MDILSFIKLPHKISIPHIEPLLEPTSKILIAFKNVHSIQIRKVHSIQITLQSLHLLLMMEVLKYGPYITIIQSHNLKSPIGKYSQFIGILVLSFCLL